MTQIIKEFQRINATENISNFYTNYVFEDGLDYRIQIYKIDYTGNWTTCMELVHYKRTGIPNRYFVNTETNKNRYTKEGFERDPSRNVFIQRIMDNHKIEKIKIVLTPIVIIPPR